MQVYLMVKVQLVVLMCYVIVWLMCFFKDFTRCAEFFRRIVDKKKQPPKPELRGVGGLN